MTPEEIEIALIEKKIYIGNKIKRLREEQGLTKYRTAKNLNIPNQTVEAVIQASNAYQIDTLLRLLMEVGKTLTITNL